jgi:ribosomal protein L11 methyltransferase
VPPRFPFVAVVAPAGRADELCALLFELGASGVEQRDDETHPSEAERLPLDVSAQGAAGAAWPELRVRWRDEGSPGGQLPALLRGGAAAGASCGEPRLASAGGEPPPEWRVTLLGSFESRALAEAALRELGELEPELGWRGGELVGDEWRERYKLCFSPFALTGTIRIVPPWIAAGADGGDGHQRLLWLDPGRAFGTGLHASTALVAGILEQRAAELSGASVLDVGTGSGILALVALLHGAARATAVDNDADALAVARANAERNGLGARMEISAQPLAAVAGTFPWVVANIELGVLCALAPELVRHVAPGGRLVLSGLLVSQREQALARFLAGTELDLEQEQSRQPSGEAGPDAWLALVLRRSARGQRP